MNGESTKPLAEAVPSTHADDDDDDNDDDWFNKSLDDFDIPTAKDDRHADDNDGDDDDDWFNKSLDDFDVPTAKDDRWSGEDERKDEEEDAEWRRTHTQDSRQSRSPGRKKENVGKESLSTVRTSASADKDVRKKPSTTAATTQGAAATSPRAAGADDKRCCEGNKDSASHDDDDGDSDESDDEDIILQSVGVTLSLKPEELETGGHFSLLLPINKPRQAGAENTDQAHEARVGGGDNDDKSQGDTETVQTPSASRAGDDDRSQGDAGTTKTPSRASEEEDIDRNQGNIKAVKTPSSSNGAEERERPADKGRLTEVTDIIMIHRTRKKRPAGEPSCSRGQGQANIQPEEQPTPELHSQQGEQSTPELHSQQGEQSSPELHSQQGEQSTPELHSQREPDLGKNGDVDGKRTGEEKGGEEEEEETVEEYYKEVTVRTTVPPVVNLDEDWFQERLNQLPTLFNQRRVHGLSEARLQSNLQIMLKGMRAEGADDDDSNIKTSTPPEYDNDSGARSSADLQQLMTVVELLKTKKNGDFDVVYIRKLRRIPENKTPQPRRGLFCLRSRYYANFVVVLKWLLGNRREAEREARHLVSQHPCSFVSLANLFYILWRKGERQEAVEFLSPFTLLKERRPDVYQTILCEDEGELALCYTELGPEFIPNALAIMEEVVSKKPHWNEMKWNMALNLRRLTNAKHNWTQQLSDEVTPLLKATELLIEIIECRRDRTAAAAELGEILNGCKFDDKLKSTVVQRAEEAGYTAAKCFDIVMQEEDTGGSNLIRAGKYFRYNGQLHNSEKALKKAVAVQDSAKAHHQLALTLRRLATEERRRALQNWRQGRKPTFSQVGPRRGASRQQLGVISRARQFARDSNMANLERSMKAVVYQTFSREDQYVKETMYHFNRAIMLSCGENCAASYDLGLMYKALGEYREALEQFLLIANIDSEPAALVNAFEQSGLVTLEKCSLEENESRARAMLEDGKSMLTMAILIQSRLVQQFRGTEAAHAVWRSCYSLGQYLQLQQDIEGVFEEDSPVEVWLLRLLRVYADTLPVLTSLQQFSPRDIESPQGLMGRLHKYLRDQRHEDVILFTHLLHLTDQGKDMRTKDLDLCLRALVLGARAKLMLDIKAGLLGSTLNTNMARRFFRWAFEDVYINIITSMQDTENPPVCADNVSLSASPTTGCRRGFSGGAIAEHCGPDTQAKITVTKNGHKTTDSRKLPDPFKDAGIGDSMDPTRPNPGTSQESYGDPATGNGEHGRGSGQRSSTADSVRQTALQPQTVRYEQPGDAEDEEEDQSLDHHMVLVHDPQDEEAARVARGLQSVLQGTCGLRAFLPESGTVDFMSKATLEAMDCAHHLLFVLGCREISPELENYIQHATAKCSEDSGPSTPSVDGRGTRLRAVSSVFFRDAGPQPSLLQSRPAFTIQDVDRFLSPGGRRSVQWVDSVCALFCFLIGLNLKF